jgi:hypothetical protein
VQTVSDGGGPAGRGPAAQQGDTGR